jgi:hypothetical protein
MRREICQFKASLSLTVVKKTDLTISGFTAGISQPRAFKGQLLPTAKGANSSRMKFFNAVICLESSLMEFGHTLDQSGQAVIHRRLVPLIFDDGGGGVGACFPTVSGCACQQEPTFVGILSSNS